MLIELYVDEFVVAFDGRVVERFGGEPMRLHVTSLTRAEIGTDRKGRRELTIDAVVARGTRRLSGAVDADNVARAEQLVAAINEARADYGQAAL